MSFTVLVFIKIVAIGVGKCEHTTTQNVVPYHPVYSCSDTDLLPIRDHLGQTETHKKSVISFMQFSYEKKNSVYINITEIQKQFRPNVKHECKHFNFKTVRKELFF